VDIMLHCVNAAEGGRTKFNHCSCHVTSRRVVTYSVNFSGLCSPCMVCSTNSALIGHPLRSVKFVQPVVRCLFDWISCLSPS